MCVERLAAEFFRLAQIPALERNPRSSIQRGYQLVTRRFGPQYLDSARYSKSRLREVVEESS